MTIMRLNSPAVIALTVLAAAAGVSVIALQQAGSARDSAKVYADACASCHGPKLQGGQGVSLVDDEWKHGGDDASIAKSIREGQPAMGMPPFGGSLIAQDIRAMVIYIREEGATFKRRRRSSRSRPGDVSVRAKCMPSGWRRHHRRERALGHRFLPDGRILVTERPGRCGRGPRRGLRANQRRAAGVHRGTGRLLDVAVHPDYAKNGWIICPTAIPATTAPR